MNTPAHLLIGAAVMGRKGGRLVMLAAMIGALLPDMSLYLMAGVSLTILDIPPRVVFDELYFSDLWQTVFAIDNSFIIWGVLLAIALWQHSAWAVALTGAAILHLLLDFPLHHDDGRPHFWPLSSWVFESPVSYWDRSHGARWIAPIEATLASVSAVALWMQRPGWALSILIALLLVAEWMVARVWMFVFSSG